MVLPTTAGNKCAPATVLELRCVTWKYNGTLYIICQAVRKRFLIQSKKPKVVKE